MVTWSKDEQVLSADNVKVVEMSTKFRGNFHNIANKAIIGPSPCFKEPASSTLTSEDSLQSLLSF